MNPALPKTYSPSYALLALVLLLCHAPAGAQNPAPGTAPPPMPPTAPMAPAPVMPQPGDPARPAPGPALTLDEAVAHAVQNNPRIGGAAALIREAQARVTQRRAVRGPQVSNDNAVFRQGPPIERGGGNGFTQPVWRWNMGLNLRQILFDFGQRAALQRAAQRDVEAAGFRRGETENDVRFVVGVAFYDVFRADELIQVAQERVTSTTEQLRVARARFETDVSPRFDVIRSEAELANAQQELIEARNERSLAEAAFNTALGRDVTTPVNLAPTPAPALPDVSFERLREIAVQQRPQLQALRAEVAGGEETIRARRAENRPQIALNGAYNRVSPNGFFSTPYQYEVGLVMTFPFFDNGLTRGRVREAQAVVQGMQADLEQARQQVELEIRQAQLNVSEASARITTARTELAAAREALRVAEVRYRAGVGTNVEVTDAQVAVARAGQNLANAHFDLQAALVRLRYAVGGPLDESGAGAPGTGAPGTTPGTGTPGTPTPGAGTPGGAGQGAQPGSGRPNR